MDKNFAAKYAARVSAAGPLELVVITYEMAMDFMETALTNADSSAPGEAVWIEYLEKARAAIALLSASLDLRLGIGRDLRALYNYVSQKLQEGVQQHSSASVREAVEIFGRLLESWRSIEKESNANQGENGHWRRAAAQANTCTAQSVDYMV
ncbi:MAG: flagellar protein FliS [Clostridiales bacterium]|nr:flagellar protein FliS [Clostridiales bacterium]